jgi:hypothetical protein
VQTNIVINYLVFYVDLAGHDDLSSDESATLNVIDYADVSLLPLDEIDPSSRLLFNFNGTLSAAQAAALILGMEELLTLIWS